MNRLHPSERFEASTRRCMTTAVLLSSVALLGFQLTEWFPAGGIWAAVGVLMFFGGFIPAVPWVAHSAHRIGLWWNTRGYEVDQ